MHCTSAGKVILANLPRNEVIDIIQQTGLPRHTEKTITTEKELLENLVMIKQRGFGIEREENETGITCIAAPIFNHRGEIAGAISISGTALRMNDDKIAAIKDKLIEVGTKVSQRLGLCIQRFVRRYGFSFFLYSVVTLFSPYSAQDSGLSPTSRRSPQDVPRFVFLYLSRRSIHLANGRFRFSMDLVGVEPTKGTTVTLETAGCSDH